MVWSISPPAAGCCSTPPSHGIDTSPILRPPILRYHSHTTTIRYRFCSRMRPARPQNRAVRETWAWRARILLGWLTHCRYDRSLEAERFLLASWGKLAAVPVATRAILCLWWYRTATVQHADSVRVRWVVWACEEHGDNETIGDRE
jgi:hypothetical protein